MTSLSKKQHEQRNEIIEQLYLKGPLSRADLAKILQITPATMTELTGYLIKEGLLLEIGEELDSQKAGRRKILLDVVANYCHYIGVELTEDRLILCLTDNRGICLETQKIGADKPLNEQELVSFIQQFIQQCSDYTIEAIGIAVPGHYSKDSNTILTNNILWSNFDLTKVISAFNIPVYVKNNVKCMALSELYSQENDKLSNFLFLNLRRGIFGAYVYNSKIYGDTNLFVGEIGHVVVNHSGSTCECGKDGCLQTYAGAEWLLRKARYAYTYSKETRLKDLVNNAEEIEISHLITAYHMGDDFVRHLLDQAIEYLALQLNNCLMLLDVDAIYLHGKLFADSSLAEKLTAKIDQYPSLLKLKRNIKMTVKAYKSERGALGGAMFAVYKHFIHQKIEG
ncbi:ROK family protein [Ursidibacter arcticus]